MATRQVRRDPPEMRVKPIGTFTIIGTAGDKRLTLSRQLENADFPTELGAEVDVVLVEPDNGDNYIELRQA